MHQLQSFALYLLCHHRENLLLSLLIFGQEDKSCAIPALFGHRDALQQDEFMRNLQHDACSVACLITRLGTSVFHVLQHFQCVVNKFVALASVNVYHHAHAAGIVLVCFLI